MKKTRASIKSTTMLFSLALFLAPAAAYATEFLIHISVDGLRADIVTKLGAQALPNFYRLRHQGAFIDNARTDLNSTYTLPNHVSMLCGRPLDGIDGHHYDANHFPLPFQTLHTKNRRYIASIFDVVHDHGLSTGLFVGKAKFVIFERSYNANNGALDPIGIDNGRDKIDTYIFESDTAQLVDQYVARMQKSPLNYSFVHLRDPDAAGHAETWDLDRTSEYARAVRRIDSYLGEILQAIDDNRTLRGKTAIILTADHGGELGADDHEASDHYENYTIPFYVWGLNEKLYTNAVRSRTSALAANLLAGAAPRTPIFNGDSANLALAILHLPRIPESTLVRLHQRFQAITSATSGATRPTN